MKYFPIERFLFLLMLLREVSRVKSLDFCFDARLEGKNMILVLSFSVYVCFLYGVVMQFSSPAFTTVSESTAACIFLVLK